jgi:PAS domain S-box-containing protein
MSVIECLKREHGFFRISSEGEVLEISNLCISLLNSRSDLIGADWLDVADWTPDSIANWNIAFNRLIENSIPIINQIFTINDNSEIHYLELLCDFENPESSVIEGFIKDVTLRENQKNEIENSNWLYQEAQKIAKVGSWKHYIKTGRVNWSDEIYRIVGISKEEYPALTIEQAFIFSVHPDDLKKVSDAYDEAIKIKKDHIIEHRVLLQDGAIKYVRENSVTKYSNSGEPISVEGTIQDITKEKLAEVQLKDSEKRLKNAQKVAKIGDWSINFTTGIVTASDEAYSIYGVTREEQPELSMEFVRTRHHPEDREWAQKEFETAIAEHKDSSIEYRIVMNDGTVKYVKTVNVATYSENGKPTSLFGVIHDITDQHFMQERLKESEEMFRTVANYTYDWEYWLDPTGVFIYVAPAVERITGYSADCFLGNSYEKMVEIIHPDDKDNFKKHLENGLNVASNILEMDMRIIHSSGEVRWISHACQPIENNGVYLGQRASNRDITEHKKLLSKVESSERRLSQIANNIEEIFWLVSIDGTVKMVNNAFEDIFSHSIEAEGFNFWALPVWSRIDATNTRELFKKMAGEKKQHFTIEVNWVCSDGSSRICRNNVSLVFSEDGTVRNFAIISQDITRYKEMASKEKNHQEQLRQADKMTSMGVLVSGVAHEINNPNNLIMLNSAFVSKVWKDMMPILKEGADKDPYLKFNNLPYSLVESTFPDMLKNICIGSERIKGIVHSLKEFVRVDTGKLDEQVDINSTVKEAVMIVDNLIKKSTYHFTTHYGENIPSITGNKQQLEQVILNLLTNACQALTSSGDAISIFTRVDDNCIKIEVKDEGEGISEEVLQKMKDPFFTTKRDSGGTGLGLSVSHSIIEAHGGLLEYQSEEGRGTTAAMILPIINQPKENCDDL